jgi:CBS domain-containing protein
MEDQMHNAHMARLVEVFMRVDEVMIRDIVTVPCDAVLAEAAELMKTHNVGFLPVVAGDILVGVVTDRDLVVRGICERANPYLTQVRSIMSTKPITCYAHDVLTNAVDILADNHIRRLIVIDSYNKLVGLLSLDDLAAHMSSDRLLGDLLRHVSAA